MGVLLDECLRRRAGSTPEEWRRECEKGRIPGSKLLASQSGTASRDPVSLRTLGRALRARPGDGVRIRIEHADQLLMAAGYGPEALQSICPLEFPGWAYALSEECLHVDPDWGI